MRRIAETFSRLRSEGQRGLIPFVTAGDPDADTTCDLVTELARVGASMVEIGVPFTDPMADGPVIQQASMRALRNGCGVAQTLDIIRKVRSNTDVPLVLFSYFNPLLQFGIERLAAEARQAGADAVLVTDLPPEEAADLIAAFARNELDVIFLVAPTSSDERLRAIAEHASGFIYAVSRTGVTGAQTEVSNEARRLVSRVRRVTDLPIAVGFGISTRAQISDVWDYADATVVGSALVAEIERLKGSADLIQQIGNFMLALTPQQQNAVATVIK